MITLTINASPWNSEGVETAGDPNHPITLIIPTTLNRKWNLEV